MKKCPYCDSQFFHKGTVCRVCVSRIRRYKNKNKAVEYLGGKCINCGYNGHLAALEFHHVHGKDIAIGKMMNRKWEIIQGELDKCILLCSNCHRIEHSKYGQINDLISSGG